MGNAERPIGLVGLGYWGKNILRNLYSEGVLHTACDSNINVVSQKKEEFPGINYTNSLSDILDNPEIKAVVISTPATTHRELIEKCFSAGKDVMVEKPLALTAKEGDVLVKLAEKKQKILMVGHILQYHPAVIALKDLISSGELGKIQYIYSNRLNIGKLRTEENILWSFAPHDISVILMLLDEFPEEVSAFGNAYLNDSIYDITLTKLGFKSGVKGHVFVSWLHPFKEQKLVVVGSGAMAVFDDISKEKLVIYRHKIEWKNGRIPIALPAMYEVIPVKNDEPLKQELRHFIECVLTRKKPLTDGQEGLRVLRVIESAELSLSGNEIKRQRLEQKGFYVHESSFVDEGVKIGKNTKIWHFSHILENSVIGDDCTIGQNVSIGPDAYIGNRCKIQNNVSIYRGVCLEDEVFCGPSCVFTNVYNPRAFIERKQEFEKTNVKRGATIGANAAVVCGNTIGRYAMVGAGSVVKSDVPDYAVVVGVPARQIGWVCKCGTTLDFDKNNATCKYCGGRYKCENGRLEIIEETRLN